MFIIRNSVNTDKRTKELMLMNIAMLHVWVEIYKQMLTKHDYNKYMY